MDNQVETEGNESSGKKSTKRRIQILAVLCVGVVIARIAIKPPPPPKQPDHSNKPFRALPGVLERLPESERAKLSPQILAQLQEVDRANQKGRTNLAKEALASLPHEKPNGAQQTQPLGQADTFQYAQRKIQKNIPEVFEKVDVTKTMLVIFRKGGFVKARKAEFQKRTVDILIDKSLHATFPHRMVSSISNNAVSWKEPIPAGFIQLKPAKGIKIVLAKQTAKRISIRS